MRSATTGKPPLATVYGNAFIPGAGSVTANGPAATPLTRLSLPPPTGLASSQTCADAVPSPDYGLSMFLWDQPNTTNRDLKIASGANFHWQKTLFAWRSIEGTGKGVYNWTEADRIVKASTANGIKIIARIDFQPAWARKDKANNGPPDNYQDYADFITAFAGR